MERGENACRCFFFFQLTEWGANVDSNKWSCTSSPDYFWYALVFFSQICKTTSGSWQKNLIWLKVKKEERKKERSSLNKQQSFLNTRVWLRRKRLAPFLSFFQEAGAVEMCWGRRLAPQRRRGRQKSRRERTSASTTGSGKWDQSNERQMPPISHTWTRMIPLVHVDCCAALMAQHLQFNRGSSETIWMLIILSVPLWCLWFTLR